MHLLNKVMNNHHNILLMNLIYNNMKTINFFLICIIFSLMISNNLLAGDATIAGNIVRKVSSSTISPGVPIKDCNGNVTGTIPGTTTTLDTYPAYTAFTTVTIKIYAKDTAGSPISTISSLSKTAIGFNTSTGAFSYPVTGIAASRYSYIAKVCLDADVSSAYVREFTISTGGAIFPIGSVIAYTGYTSTVADLETSGWYKCDGRLISSLTASLSADEISAFQNTVGSYLPDLRGVFLRGLDEARGYDDDRLTRTGGEGTTGVGSYQSCKIQDHSISGTTNTTGNHRHTGTTDEGGYQRSQDDGGTSGTAAENSGGHTHTFTTNYAGDHSHTVSGSYTNSGGNETRPENIAVYYIVRGR
jgi:hypothetical protein